MENRFVLSWRSAIRRPGRWLARALTAAAPLLAIAGPACGQEGWTLLDNSVVRVTSSLEVSQAVLLADDGVKKQNDIVDNQMGDNSLGLFAEFAPFGGGDWTAGAELEVDVFHLRSDEINVIDSKHNFGAEVGDASVWLRHRLLGTFTVGLTGGATDGIGEYDLSETEIVGSVNQDDIGGEILLRGANNEPVTTFRPTDPDPVGYFWRQPFNSLDNFGGPSGQAARWDSAKLAGFQVSAAVGEFSIWDASIRYEREFDAFEVEGGLGLYHETGKSLEELAGNTYLGSIAALHKPSGLSLAFAAGQQSFEQAIVLNDGSSAKPKDRGFVYGKLGSRHSFFDFGDTAFYAEAGQYRDGLGLDVDRKWRGGVRRRHSSSGLLLAWRSLSPD